MLGVTLTPTMAHASDKINVIPSRAWAQGRLPRAAGAGRRRGAPADRHVLGELAGTLEVEFTEQVTGNASPVASPLMDAIDRWVRSNDPGAETVPLILPGFTDSRWFREPFPDCVAYGFFPHAPHDPARDLAARAQRRRADRRPRPGVRRGLLPRPGPGAARN